MVVTFGAAVVGVRRLRGMMVLGVEVRVVHNRGRRRRGRIGARIQQVQLLAREDILVVLPFPASHQFFSNALQSTFHLRGFSRRLFPPGHMHSASGTASEQEMTAVQATFAFRFRDMVVYVHAHTTQLIL